MLRGIVNLVMDILGYVFDLIKRLFFWVINKFLEINMFEKLIVVLTPAAFLAVVLPVARFTIFDRYHDINNPLSVYLIGIIFLMLMTVLFPGIITVASRVGLNGIYFIWILVLFVSDGISKAHTEPSFRYSTGIYINMIVPVLYIILSLLSFIKEYRR